MLSRPPIASLRSASCRPNMAPALMTPEAVQEIENHFFVGNYQDAVADALEFTPEDDVSGLFRDFYLYRAYIAQRKYSNVLSEITRSHHPALRAVRIFAEYTQNRSQADKREAAVSEIRSLMTSSSHPLVNIMAATIFNHEDNAADALRALHNEDSLEGYARAALVPCAFSSLTRHFGQDGNLGPDLPPHRAQRPRQANGRCHAQARPRRPRHHAARRSLGALRCRRRQSAGSHVHLPGPRRAVCRHCAGTASRLLRRRCGGELTRALPALLLQTLNGQAVCHMLRGKYSEAQDLLNEALERVRRRRSPLCLTCIL